MTSLDNSNNDNNSSNNNDSTSVSDGGLNSVEHSNDTNNAEYEEEDYLPVDEDDEDYYDYYDTEYDYLPEFNATPSSHPRHSGRGVVLGRGTVGAVNSSVATATVDSDLDDAATPRGNNFTVSIDDDDEEAMSEVRMLLKTLLIDEEMFFLILGCTGIVLLLIIILVVSIIIYRRRYPVRLGLGRKFDTFQNPIYEKTMVRVPMQVDEVENTEEQTAAAPLPLATKAEMEDLSDSTVME